MKPNARYDTLRSEVAARLPRRGNCAYEQVREILQAVALAISFGHFSRRPYRLRLYQVGSGRVQANLLVPDVEDGFPTEISSGSPAYDDLARICNTRPRDPDRIIRGFVRQIRIRVRKLLFHEIDEQLTVAGVRLFDPHK